jgi:ribosomal protein L40E
MERVLESFFVFVIYGLTLVPLIASAILRLRIVASGTPKYRIQPHVLKRLVEQKVCEYCNTVNVASAYTCIKCQREFGSISMTHPTIETMSLNKELRTQVNDGKVQLCRNCGRLNSPTRTTCKTCLGDLSA